MSKGSRLFGSEGDLLEAQLQREQGEARLTFNGIDPSAPQTGRVTRTAFERYIQMEFGLNPERADIKKTIDAMGSDIITFDTFYSTIMGSDDTVLQRAFSNSLAVPNFKEFCEDMKDMLEEVRSLQGGHVATYIPQLACQDPDFLALSICTVDGQRFSYGDYDVDFTIQSCSKVFTYLMALADSSTEEVHSHVGVEPSGRAFNEFVLDKKGKPHNPMINAGAITICSLVKRHLKGSQRFADVLNTFSDFAGGARIGFDQATYLSEKATADRNFALAYYMAENGVFPEGTDLVKTLEFYFQTCSILVTCRKMAVMAATLANGGVCPTTAKRVAAPENVKCALQMMYSCGMYDYSGEWSCTVGLPAKSGVAGAVNIVIPGIMGINIWSPPLDERGNSFKGVEFCRRLTHKHGFSIFDQLVMEAVKRTDPGMIYFPDAADALEDARQRRSQPEEERAESGKGENERHQMVEDEEEDSYGAPDREIHSPEPLPPPRRVAAEDLEMLSSRRASQEPFSRRSTAASSSSSSSFSRRASYGGAPVETKRFRTDEDDAEVGVPTTGDALKRPRH